MISASISPCRQPSLMTAIRAASVFTRSSRSRPRFATSFFTRVRARPSKHKQKRRVCSLCLKTASIKPLAGTPPPRESSPRGGRRRAFIENGGGHSPTPPSSESKKKKRGVFPIFLKAALKNPPGGPPPLGKAPRGGFPRAAL